MSTDGESMVRSSYQSSYPELISHVEVFPGTELEWLAAVIGLVLSPGLLPEQYRLIGFQYNLPCHPAWW